MAATLLHICHHIAGHRAAYMAAGGAVGCFLHCAGTCALCLSGGAALGAAFVKSCRMVASRLAPALFAFGASTFFSAGV